MTAVGGSIEGVSLSGRGFAIPADNEAQINMGGYNNASEANGNFTSRLIKTSVPLKIDGLLVEIDHTNGDLEYLQELADLKDYFVIDITLADGTVYDGLAQIEGEVNGSTQSATAAITLSGTGKLNRQK